MGLYLPPPQAFLIVFFLAERTIGRLGENKRARAGAGSERSSSPPHDSVRPSSLANYYTFFARANGDESGIILRLILLPRMKFCCLLFRNFNWLCHNCKSKRTYHLGISSWKSEAKDNKNQFKESLEIVRVQDITMLSLKIGVLDKYICFGHTVFGWAAFFYIIFFKFSYWYYGRL